MDESTSLNLGRILANVPRTMLTYPSYHQFPKNASIFFLVLFLINTYTVYSSPSTVPQFLLISYFLEKQIS